MPQYPFDNPALQGIMLENDRRGEQAIACFQALIALIVFGFHLVSASKNQWGIFSPLTLGIATCIIFSCGLRLWLANWKMLPNFWLNVLTVLDGCFIFAIIISYSFAYSLPIESSFKAPSIIFLVLYTGARVLKFDPIPILVAGTTVVIGWLFLLFYSVMSGANVTSSYREHVSSGKLLIGANIEMAVGFIAVTGVLVVTSIYARRILANTADIGELEEAKQRAEEIAARHVALFQSSTDGILVVDQMGTIERVNPKLEEMFGHSAQNLTGKNVALLMSQTNATMLARDINSFQENKVLNSLVVPLNRRGFMPMATNFQLSCLSVILESPTSFTLQESSVM